jgi:tetratricopeptide (TPR) repeat protein
MWKSGAGVWSEGARKRLKAKGRKADNRHERRQVTDGFPSLSRDVTSTNNRKLRVLGAVAAWIAVLAFFAVLPGRSWAADADDEAAGGTAPPATTAERPAPDLRELEQWLEQKARSQQVAMPAEARLAYRHGLIAWKALEEPQAVSLLRGAGNLDPSFVAPHLTLGWWFLTREPSQALLSWASFLHRFKEDFSLQLQMGANLVFFGLHALFFGLLAAGLVLIGLHQHELRHVWCERLGIVLAPRSAQIWAWVFLVMPWMLGLGAALPALVMLAMLWPVLKARERFVFLALAALVASAPLASTVLGRLAMPLRGGGAPFYGVTALDQRDYSAEDHERVARLAAEHPDSPYLQFALGWLARRAGDLDGAEAAYRKTLKLWPASDEALNNLGNLLAMQGRFDDALASFRKASDADPKNAAAFFNASQVHTRLFDYRAASDAVARASALDFEMVKSYQARSGESGDLPLVDQWIDPAAFWRTLLAMKPVEVAPALPLAWRPLIETSGWPFSAATVTLTLLGLALGIWWQAKMPLRTCSNCGRAVCRRCAQRVREVALCRECSAIAARAESGEFGRVLLMGRRRQVERKRTVIRTIGASLVPGLGLLARRKVFSALVLLAVTADLVTRWLDVRAPFGEVGHGAIGSPWGLPVCALLVYALSMLGYLRSRDPDAAALRVTASRQSEAPERSSRVA